MRAEVSRVRYKCLPTLTSMHSRNRIAPALDIAPRLPVHTQLVKVTYTETAFKGRGGRAFVLALVYNLRVVMVRGHMCASVNAYTNNITHVV